VDYLIYRFVPAPCVVVAADVEEVLE